MNEQVNIWLLEPLEKLLHPYQVLKELLIQSTFIWAWAIFSFLRCPHDDFHLSVQIYQLPICPMHVHQWVCSTTTPVNTSFRQETANMLSSDPCLQTRRWSSPSFLCTHVYWWYRLNFNHIAQFQFPIEIESLSHVWVFITSHLCCWWKRPEGSHLRGSQVGWRGHKSDEYCNVAKVLMHSRRWEGEEQFSEYGDHHQGGMVCGVRSPKVGRGASASSYLSGICQWPFF